MVLPAFCVVFLPVFSVVKKVLTTEETRGIVRSYTEKDSVSKLTILNSFRRSKNLSFDQSKNEDGKNKNIIVCVWFAVYLQPGGGCLLV